MDKSYNKWFPLMLLGIGLAMVLPVCAGDRRISAEQTLGLAQTVAIAQANDPWLQGNRHSQNAVEAESVAAGTLPDPKVSLTAANLPTDTFNVDQEAMTQFSVGVTQMFPRGDSRELMQKQMQLMGRQYPFQRQDRRAKVAVTASHLWLDAWLAQQSIDLIEKDRALFELLVDISQAGYATAAGKSRQQDLIRAQLELTRLEDRLTMLNQQREEFKQRLSEWIGSDAMQPLTKVLPELALMAPLPTRQETWAELLLRHPAVLALDKKIEASETGVALARQKYKPEWGVTASYGYRDEGAMGNDRADLFSVGVSFDVPLFTANRQDKEVSAARSKAEAVKTEKQLLLRQMVSAFETASVQLARLDERHRLYTTRLLPQMHEQAEASLTAYTNDEGDFAEVVRARIAELNAKIDALGIAVQRQKTIAQLNYFFTAISGADNE